MKQFPQIRDLPQHHPLAQERAIWLPQVSRKEYAWALFRCELELAEEVAGALLWWSGSQRCTLWLDGELLTDGPARSDRETWPWVTTALPSLGAGRHCLAVEVHHAAEYAGKGQIGGPAFWLCCSDHPKLAGWGSSTAAWKAFHDTSRQPFVPPAVAKAPRHRAVGRGQELLADSYPWGWQQVGADAAHWLPPAIISEHHGNPWGNRSLGCHLVAHDFPSIPRQQKDWQRVWIDYDQQEGAVPNKFRITKSTRLICDAGAVLIGYPQLSWRGGAGSSLLITACEAPIGDDRRKLDRANPLVGHLPGLVDSIRIEVGSESTHSWQPEWIRALRYLVVDIKLGGQALELDLPIWREASYPLTTLTNISLPESPDRPWSELIAVNRQTAASCAHETFFDCPAWEQAQFPGDARIQARHHYLVGNDDRLGLKAIRDCAASVSPSGLLRSHWPSSFEQIIATYSLQWIGMVSDHHWHFGRPEAWADLLPTARGIMAWFSARTREDGLLGHIAEAPFIDWAFQAGCPPQDSFGGSALLTALAAESMEMLAELEAAAGYPELVPRWQQQAAIWRKGVAACWDMERKLYRDTLHSNSFSMHTQVQVVLAGVVADHEAAGVLLSRAKADSAVQQPFTLFYRSHLAAAWRLARQGAEVVRMMDDWFRLLSLGISTWPENDSDQARSDCHAWGCMPEIEIVSSLFGLTAAKPGWRHIRLQPQWAALAEGGSCSLQVPSGELAFSCESGQNGLHWQLVTPAPCTDWQGEELPAGSHEGLYTLDDI